MKKIELHSQIVPVQTNKAQVCLLIYDNQPQKKKQKKAYRKASAQSRVAFFLSSYRSTVCLDQALAILRRTQRGQ